ncbi:hypothetical protein FO519_002661 [Halicephalobus sp. NKZ332]|nr:hypothetical protein FO519_002661 [Halicephalobus sp. NKZ332]
MRRRGNDNTNPSRPPRFPSDKKSKKTENRTFLYLAVVALLSITGFLIALRLWAYPTAPVISKLPNASLENSYDQYSWGSYRPQLYFGLQARFPQSPMFGLIWYKLPGETSRIFRHWCDQGEGIKYIWTESDGRTFGHQELIDEELSFTTDWIGKHRSFSTVLKLNPKASELKKYYGFIFYFYDPASNMRPVYEKQKLKLIKGNSPGYGNYEIKFSDEKKVSETSFSGNFDPTFFGEVFQENLIKNRGLSLSKNKDLRNNEGRSLWYIHYLLEDTATLEFNFIAEGDQVDQDIDSAIQKKKDEFHSTFAEAFDLTSEDSKSPHISTAKAALSNLLGGIGYWHGHSLVRVGKEPQPYGPLTLISAVPSRPFFPRGFLWDEGFHNLVIKNFNPSLTLDIVGSWLDCMDSEGWIPREMILTSEAAKKVPPEYIIQAMDVANPPAFFYLVDSLLESRTFMTKNSRAIYKFYPRLKQWYLWLRNSQVGSQKGTFRWRGRNQTTEFELNPKTLASGLDDYPRASHPTDDEYHLDLLCWMALSSRVVRHLAELTSDHSFMPEIETDMRLFNDFENLNKRHWSDEKKAYFDYGKHSTSVGFRKIRKNEVEEIERKRTVKKPPRMGFVDDVFGYVNLFPFLMRLLPENSEQLQYTLEKIQDELLTPYGLRSLSKNSAYYLKRNTPDDPPYWRGQIWINLNYLALNALRHYSKSGPHSEVASDLYTKLRQSLVENIHSNYVKTGYFWEHYNDASGKGGGSHPFTGWTSLFVNIVTEKFN